MKSSHNKLPTGRLDVYDGTMHVGHIVEDRAGRFHAFDSAGKPIGIYPTQKAAARAIPSADSRRAGRG
jgi:hypothetical protein